MQKFLHTFSLLAKGVSILLLGIVLVIFVGLIGLFVFGRAGDSQKASRKGKRIIFQSQSCVRKITTNDIQRTYRLLYC